MPQLDIVYIFTNYVWTWFILMSLVWKIKTTLFNKSPEEAHPMEELKAKPTWTLPWT